MPAWWLSRVCRATMMSAFDSAKKASRACELWAVSRRMSAVGCWRSASAGAASAGRGRWRRASHPTTAGHTAAIAIPSMAKVCVGCQAMKATPMTSRGIPSAR